MRINRHDTNGTKPLLGKGELGYDDYSAGGDTGRVYVGTGSENIPLAKRLDSNMMTKAQFNSLAEERKASRAGSGFEDMGKHLLSGSHFVNEGLTTYPNWVNYITLGYTVSAGGGGTSKTEFSTVNIGGVKHRLSAVNNASLNAAYVTLSTAPNVYPHDATLTAEQIASGVIKHADASNSGLVVNGKGLTGTTFTQTITVVIGKKYIIEYKDSGVRKTLEVTATSTSYSISLSGTDITEVGMYPLDAISRTDLVLLESWHEDIAEKGFGYSFGNTQYLGGNTDGLTGIANGAFTGFETYSLFGNWQTPSSLIGKGYVWSNLTEAQKRAFIANPENNCYLDGDKVIQVRYRVRVAQGIGDNWNYPSPNKITGAVRQNALLSYNNYSATLGYSKNITPRGKLTSISTEYVDSESNVFAESSFITSGTAALLAETSRFGMFIGCGNTSANNSYNINESYGYGGKCFAIPIALVHRRNQGMYHNVYNPNGTKVASDGLDCFRTGISFTSINDCFDTAKLSTPSGYIGSVSGRPDGLFYDQVHESDILDLRNSSKKVEDYNRLIGREFNKLVAGTYRGKEGEWVSEVISYTMNSSAYTLRPDCSHIFNNLTNVISKFYAGRYDYVSWSDAKIYFIDDANKKIALGYTFDASRMVNQKALSEGGVIPTMTQGITYSIYISYKCTRTKSNTLLHCDIIGNPANYPTAWKESVVFGTPLIVAEDGTSLLPDGVKDTFKLSMDANATPLLCLRSTNNGATWTSFTPTFSTITNAITLTDEPAGNLVLVYYQTKTTMATPTINSEVLELGEVLGTNGLANGALVSTLIGKAPTANTAPYSQRGYGVNGYRIDTSTFKFSTTVTELPVHSALSLAGGASGVATVKVLSYLTRLNGKVYLNLVFKEMKHNGTSWGDSGKFEIVDNVSTTTDNNAQTILIGTKTVELPYFIGASE